MQAKGHFIKLFRSLLTWEWYSDTNTTRLFIHLLLMARFEDTPYKGRIVPRGSLMTTLPKLSKETGLSIRQIRTVLERLKSSSEIDIQATNRESLVTVLKYSVYQAKECKSDRQTTDERQANDRQTTGVQKKKEKKEKNITPISPFEGRSFSPELQSEIENWIAYKNERREGYKPRGLQALLTQIENRQKQFTDEQIINLISECMARNYKGIIWDVIKPTVRKWRELD